MVDHLFLDQDAILTLVEVKRSSDTRIRREVVGQMLDYAANAVVYWSVETIRSQFEATCKAQRYDSEQVIIEFLGTEADPEEFWQKAKTNLRAGKIRLIFVADEIPTELQRVVEFLNAQMNSVEVLAVEIKQYVGQGLKALVPRIIGQTKPPSGSKQWDEPSFLQALETKRGIDEVAVAKKILEWAKVKMSRIWWSKSKEWSKSKDGIFIPVLNHKGADHKPIMVWTSGHVTFQFGDMQTKPPFNDEAKYPDLRKRLNAIPGVGIPDNVKSPSILLSTLKDEAVLKQFLETLDWTVQEIKAS